MSLRIVAGTARSTLADAIATELGTELAASQVARFSDSEALCRETSDQWPYPVATSPVSVATRILEIRIAAPEVTPAKRIPIAKT